MDWLRSEDLKEEKVVTTSKPTIARQPGIYCSKLTLSSFWDGPGPVVFLNPWLEWDSPKRQQSVV
jgi:hypothetical protein